MTWIQTSNRMETFGSALLISGLFISVVAVEEILLKPCNFGSVVSDPWNCRYYFHCTNGKLHRYFCGRNTVFDSSLGACVTNKKAYGCLRRPFQKRILSGKEMLARPTDGFVCSKPGFFPHKKTCKLFYRCTKTKKLMFSCPNGLLFDESTGRCDIPENVPACSDRDSQTDYAGNSRVTPDGKQYEVKGPISQSVILEADTSIQEQNVMGKESKVFQPDLNIVTKSDVNSMDFKPIEPRSQYPTIASNQEQRDIDVRIPLPDVQSADNLGNINIYLDIPSLESKEQGVSQVSIDDVHSQQYPQSGPRMNPPMPPLELAGVEVDSRNEQLNPFSFVKQTEELPFLPGMDYTRRRPEVDDASASEQQSIRLKILKEKESQMSTGIKENEGPSSPEDVNMNPIRAKESVNDASPESIESTSNEEVQPAFDSVVEGGVTEEEKDITDPWAWNSQKVDDESPWFHQREHPISSEIQDPKPSVGEVETQMDILKEGPDVIPIADKVMPQEIEPRLPKISTTLPPIEITGKPVYTRSGLETPVFRLKAADVTPSSSTSPLPPIAVTGLPSSPQPPAKTRRPPRISRKGVIVVDGKEECTRAGVHPDPEDCTRFYQCGGPFGEPFHVKCNGGLVFSRREGICDWPYKVKECKGKVPRLLPRRLLSLISEKKVRRIDAKIMYPTESKAYEPYMPGTIEQEANKPSGPTPAPTCIPESYRRDPDNCQKFYICDVKSMEHVFLCPPGLAFDDNKGVCVSEEKVLHCNAKPTAKEIQPFDLTLVRDVEGFKCPHNQDLFSHKMDCRKFYDCDEFGYANILFCPNGFVFNSFEKFCDFPDNFPLCDAKTGELMEPSTERGASADSRIEGRESYAFGLPPRLYEYQFDEKTPDALPQRNEMISPVVPNTRKNNFFIPEGAFKADPKQDDGPAPLNFVCRGPGRYSHPFDCDKFFVCGSGRPELGRCPSGLVFDSLLMTCVLTSNNMNCHQPDNKQSIRDKAKNGNEDQDGATEPIEQKFRPPSVYGFICPNDGLYPDNFDCRKFYHCDNGIVEPYYCGKGEAFSINVMSCLSHDDVPHCNTERMAEYRVKINRENKQKKENVSKFGAKPDIRLKNASNKENMTDYAEDVKDNLLTESMDNKEMVSNFQEVTSRLTDMPCEKEAIYLDPRDCRKFYHCHQGNLYQNVCPMGMLFDRKKYVCEYYRLVLDCLNNIRISGRERQRRPTSTI